MQKFKILIIIIFFASGLRGQEDLKLQAINKADGNWIGYIELNINGLFEDLFLTNGTKFIQPDSVKLSLSKEISDQFRELLLEEESFDYPFDSLKRIGIRTSQDNKIRTYTWSIKLEAGQHRYYGFIQKREGKSIKLFPLKEELEIIPEVEFESLDHQHWYGMNYYEIVDFKYRGKRHYALLGMRNNGYESKTKTIEILYFTGKKARFGRSVFVNEDKKKIKRELFEYSHKTSMVLNYNKGSKMIVFDHLAPAKSSLKGLYRFYGPDGSYDGYQFNGQKWVYKPDTWTVNERNKKQENLKLPRDNKNIYRSK
jgi:hypothetical protein